MMIKTTWGRSEEDTANLSGRPSRFWKNILVVPTMTTRRRTRRKTRVALEKLTFPATVIALSWNKPSPSFPVRIIKIA
jgi:hypothetical protein